MKVVVKRLFKDKKADVMRNVGEVFECTEERLAEILKAGPFIAETDAEITERPINSEVAEENKEESAEVTEEEIDQTEKNESTETEESAPSDFSEWTIAQLKEHAEINGVDLTGLRNKQDIIDKITKSAE